MRIVFIGTPEYAVPSLKTLISSEHEVVAVVTQPDRPKGRGRSIQQPPIKKIAIESRLKILQPEKAGEPEFIRKVRALLPDLIIVAAYGQILKQELLDIPKWFCMNLHASLLPAYRGAAPINWPILNGDARTGVTTMKMDSGLDTGDILLSRSIPIEDFDDSQILHDKLSVLGATLVLETINKIQNGMLSPQPQNNRDASYAPKLRKEFGLIRWNQSAKIIRNLVRGLRPWPGAHTSYQGKKLEITKAEEVASQKGDGPGIITRVSDYGLEVGTGAGRLVITELKPEGKRIMSVKSFLQGRTVLAGMKFDNRNADEPAA